MNSATKHSVRRGIVAKSLKRYYFMRRIVRTCECVLAVCSRRCDDNIYPAISMNIYIFIARERLKSFAPIDKMRHGKSLHS